MADRFRVDPRGLAALRIALGLLLLADLVLRSRDLVVFYTDAGVLPRAVLTETFGGLAALSFAHGLSGSPYVQGFLFAVAMLAAVALIIGYHTRLATLVSFLLLVSLQTRNPVLLNAGDSLLRRLMFWGFFLPLGGRWSVDAVRGARRAEPFSSVATAALLLQVLIVYLVNAVLKLRGEAWRSGEAILLVFQVDQLTVRLGDILAEFPVLLEGLGWLWLALLVASPLLVLLWGWPRALFAGLFASMHLGMALTMRLGLFPLISIAGLLPFVPPRVWQSLVGHFAPAVREGLQIQDCLWRLDDWLPRLPRPQIGAGARHRLRQLGSVLVALLLAGVLFWNAAGLGYATVPADVQRIADPTERRWDMFAPSPRTNDGWFVAPGELASGELVDAYGGGPLSWDRPPDLASSYPSHRWFVYMLELPRPGTGPLRAAFADYLCRRWNANHETTLRTVRLVYVLEPAVLDGNESTRRVDLGQYECPA
ncbi:MAG: HTTM domain-containing protein [Halobacteriales archaeon]